MKAKTTIFTLTLISLGALPLAAQPAPRPDINPALRYYQAFLVAPNLSETEFDFLASNNLWSASLPARFGELAGRYDDEFKILRQAVGSTVPCDWGLDLSAGPTTLLPHLARCKAAMIGARYRVAWDLQQQRQADARQDLVAAFTLARNTARDGTLISVLVQQAAECIGCDAIAENFGKFTPQTLQELVEGIDAAPTQATVAASIAVEKASFHDWLVNRVLALQRAHPGDDAKVMEGIRSLLATFEDSKQEGAENGAAGLWEQLVESSGNTSAGVLKLLREEGQACERLAGLLALPYAEFEAQAEGFAAEMKQSPNPLLSQIVPACLKARRREFKVQVWLAMLHTAVAYRFHGDPGLLSVNDPCGRGPFAFQRFILEGVDRGFQLRSSFRGSGFPEILIFVEKPGPPFFLDGPHAGQARPLPNR